MKKFIAIFMISALSISSAISVSAGEVTDKIKISGNALSALSNSEYTRRIWSGYLDSNYKCIYTFTSSKGLGVKNLDSPQIDYYVEDSTGRRVIVAKHVGYDCGDGVDEGYEGERFRVYARSSTGKRVSSKILITDNIEDWY